MKSKILCLVFMVLAFSYSCQGQSSQRAASAKIEQRKEKDVYQMVKNFTCPTLQMLPMALILRTKHC